MERVLPKGAFSRHAQKILLVLAALLVVALSSLVWTGSSSAATPGNAGRIPGDPGQSADVILGTYTVAPDPGGSDTQGGSGPMSSKINLGIAPPCTGCDITSITPDLTDTGGKSVNLDSGMMLHHAVVYQQGGQDVACPGLMGVATPAYFGERLFASGNERTTVPYVPGYGLYISPGEQFAALADIMNYSSQQQTVQVRLHVTWAPGDVLTHITPVWLDETGCNFLAPSSYSIPAGPSEQTMTWRSDIGGELIELAGHLHPYGEHIEAIDTTTRTPLCDSRAPQMVMGGMPMIANMTKCVGAGANSVITRIHSGDVIRMNAFYDAPQAESAVMGIMIMYLYQN